MMSSAPDRARPRLALPRLALGCMGFGSSAWRPWVLDEADSLAVLAQSLEAGITFFDTANVYSTGRSEIVLGRMLREAQARDRMVVATKLYFPVGVGETGLSRANVLASCDASLKRLGVERIDVLQIHCYDEDTPVEETLQALDELVRAGKVAHLGASNVRAWQLAKLNYTARPPGADRPTTPRLRRQPRVVARRAVRPTGPPRTMFLALPHERRARSRQTAARTLDPPEHPLSCATSRSPSPPSPRSPCRSAPRPPNR
jgi:hypothetical protein